MPARLCTRVAGPAVASDSNVPGLLVAARVSADGTARWLRVIAEGAEHPSAAWGLTTALEGRGGLWWDRAASGVRDGGFVLWDRNGSGSWRAPLRSVQAAAIDSHGGLILLGGVNESAAPEDRGGNVATFDSPQVLDRWAGRLFHPARDLPQSLRSSLATRDRSTWPPLLAGATR